MNRKSFIFLVLTLFVNSCLSAISGSPVILVVLDGFRHDYLGTFETPNLDKVWKTEGVLVPRLQPEFPASRLPFLASLLTGRHSETHEVISEEVYNNDNQSIIFANQTEFWTKTKLLKTVWDLEKSSKVCNCWPHSHLLLKEDRFLQQTTPPTTTPTPTTAAKSIVEGSTVSIKSSADISFEDKSTSWSNCVNETVKLLIGGKTKLISLYSNEPGRTAEIFGPDATEVGEAVAKVDSMIGDLIKQLIDAHLDDKVNLIITSTPGFSGVRPDHLINLPNEDTKTKKSTYFSFGQSPVLNIKPMPGKELDVLVMLKNAHSSKLNYDVFITAEFPDQLHYRQASAVVQPIVLLAHEGYAFTQDFAPRMKELNKLGNRTEMLTNTYGCSGYNNSLPNMQTFLIVRGPDFSTPSSTPAQGDHLEKVERATVRVVDVFALLCHLLTLDLPNAIDSELSRVAHLLKVSSGTNENATLAKVEDYLSFLLSPGNLPITISVTVGGLLLIIMFIWCIVFAAKRKSKASKATAGYRYSQVKNNRRYSPQDDPDNSIVFSAVDDADTLQEQSLLAPSAEDA